MSGRKIPSAIGLQLDLSTPRLNLQRFAPEHLAAFLRYRNDPDVARYQSWERVTEADGARFLHEQAHLQPGTPGAWFQFAVCLKPTLELVGDCGLHVAAADPRLGEIGFTFDRAHQGKGLAAEAVAAVVDYAFRQLGLHRLRAIVDCRNEPAVRLLTRLGMRREAHFLQHTWFKGAWTDEFLYALLAAEWARARTPGIMTCQST